MTGAGSRTLLAGSVVVAVVVTAVLALLPSARYAYEAPGLQIALNTADAVIALVVAYLVYGRFRQSSRVRDLLLTSSLGVLAVANLPLTALPQALTMTSDSSFGSWAAVSVRTVGAVLFAAAALTPRSARVDRRTAGRAVLVLAATVLWLGAFGLLASDRLPRAVPADVPDATTPWVAGHPLVIVLQAAGILLYATAAWAFSRAAARERDDFMHWVAAAAVLSAGARVNYLLFPSLYSDYLYSGDLLRLGFYLLLLVGAAREIRSYWSARMAAAVARGRRDALREVEDVVVEDLRAVVRRAEELPGNPTAAAAAQAARQALADVELVLSEAREESAALAADESFDVLLRDAVRAIAVRRGVEVDVRVQAGAEFPPDPENLLSLACEAVRGATRYASPSSIAVTVSADPLRLVVRDDGLAVDAAGAERAAGLQRMRRRADASDGALTVSSSEGTGTTVTIDWL